jgi:uncharacterized phage-associated protein
MATMRYRYFEGICFNPEMHHTVGWRHPVFGLRVPWFGAHCQVGEHEMTSVHDVAAYILGKYTHSIPAIKLQKLVYYSQAWSLAWEDRPLFPERIEAWVNGPVVPVLYEQHRGQYAVSSWPLGNACKITEDDASTIDAVLSFYGRRSSQWLSDLTHSEDPWIKARRGLHPSQRGTAEITLESMAEYYTSLAHRA